MFIPDTPAKPASITTVIPESHPLIEAATKPLADNAEQRLAANTLLGECFDPDHPAVAETLARFADVDSGKRPPLLSWLLPALAGICVIALAAVVIPKGRMLYDLSKHISSFMEDPMPNSSRSDLTPEQALLLGDSTKSRLEQKLALMESDPSRPDFYAEYAHAYVGQHETLPDGYFETIAKIDPDNAFFIYFAAAAIGSESVKKIQRTTTQRDNKEPQRYEVLDETAFSRSMDLFRKARGYPKFDSYDSSLLASRIPLLMQRDSRERATALAYVAGQPNVAVRFRRLADVVSAASMRFGESADTGRFRGLLEDNEHFLKLWADSPVCTVVDELVFNVWATDTTSATLHTAKQLAQDLDAETLEGRMERLDLRREWKNQRGRGEKYDRLLDGHGGLLHRALPIVALQARNPVPMTKADLKPGALADQDLLSQFLVAVACALLVLASIAVYLYRFFATRLIRSVAARMERLLDAKDAAWIMLGGVVLPLLFFILINRFTPLGGRDFGLIGLGYAFPAFHFLLLVFFILTMPVLVIRWRLLRKTRPFGLSHRKSVVGWLLLAGGAVITIIALPVVTQDKNVMGLQVLLSFPQVWFAAILITCLRAIFGTRNLRISRHATARSILPAYALGIILLASLYPALVLSERHWIAQDKLMNLDAEFPSLTTYEYKTTVQLRKEIIEILGFPK